MACRLEFPASPSSRPSSEPQSISPSSSTNNAMENDFNHTKIEETTDLRGNGLYSTAEARSGDELVRINSPLIAIPEAEVLETVCYQCFTDSSHTSLKKCAGCSVASYCSKSCQRNSWTLIHKLECQVLRDISKKQKGQPLVTAVRATMQILLKNKNTIERNRADRSWQEDRLVGHVIKMKEKDHARYDGLLLQSIAAKEFSKVEADMDSVLNLFARVCRLFYCPSTQSTLFTPNIEIHI